MELSFVQGARMKIKNYCTSGTCTKHLKRGTKHIIGPKHCIVKIKSYYLLGRILFHERNGHLHFPLHWFIIYKYGQAWMPLRLTHID